MMIETGRVVALDVDAVWVETLRASTCGSCEVRSGCGHGLLASLGRSPSLVRALRSPGAPSDIALHDEVSISIPEGVFLRGVVMLYLLPLLTTVGAAMLASALLVNDSMSTGQADTRVTLAALAGLAAGLLFVRWRGRRGEADPSLNPVVTARVG